MGKSTANQNSLTFGFGEGHSKPKFRMFYAVSQNYQHFLEK